jgi:hypothetical protein
LEDLRRPLTVIVGAEGVVASAKGVVAPMSSLSSDATISSDLTRQQCGRTIRENQFTRNFFFCFLFFCPERLRSSECAVADGVADPTERDKPLPLIFTVFFGSRVD